MNLQNGTPTNPGNTSFREYDFTLIGNGVQIIDAVGDYVKLRSASSTLTIQTDSGTRFAALPGQGFKGMPFQKIILTDTSGSGNTGTVLIGQGGEMVDDEVAGTVSVIDGGKARTLANQAFIVSSAQGNAGAGATWKQGLFMPAGSKYRCVLKSIRASTLAAQILQVRAISATLGGVSAPINKLIGSAGAANTTFVQVNDNAAYGTFVDAINAQATGSTEVIYTEPLILLPGRGLIIVNATANTDLQSTFEFIEELNV